MKLFKSLLVAPATLGLLAPIAATANEVTINDFNPSEEIDARLASGWYVDSLGNSKKKEYKTKEVSYTIFKKNK